MLRRTIIIVILLLVFTAINAQTPITPPALNEPDAPICEDPANIAGCSQDFYWDAPLNGESPNWYEIFRRTIPQVGRPTAWVKVGNSTETRWWTANDAGDSEVNSAGEVRAGQQKPGFTYEYRVRSCRLIPLSWTIKCSPFSTDSVFFTGVVYERVVE